jgi:chromate transporter
LPISGAEGEDGILGPRGTHGPSPVHGSCPVSVDGRDRTGAEHEGAGAGVSGQTFSGTILTRIAHSVEIPGVLIFMGTLPFWETFRKRAGAQPIMRGVNAAVVGLLGAALYNPVWTSLVRTPGDFGSALGGIALRQASHER